MPTAALPVSRLRQVARVLHGSDDDAVTAVGLEPRDDDLDLHLNPLDGDVALALRGFDAPSSWAAVGVTAPAHIWHLSPGGPRRSERSAPATEPGLPEQAEPVPSRLTILVARHGTALALYGSPGSPAARTLRSRAEQRGRLLDPLRRVLGLATAPPEWSSEVLWHAAWVERLVSRSIDVAATTPLGVGEAMLCHPAVTRLDRCDAEAVTDAQDLRRATSDIAARWPWARIRRAAQRGDRIDKGISPHDAHWLDVGAFARATMEGFLDHSAALDALSATAEPGVVELVATAHPTGARVT